MNAPLFIKVVIPLLVFSPVSAVYAQQEMNPDDRETLDQIIDGYVKDFGFSGSVLVGCNDKVFYERSCGFANHEYKISNSNQTKFRLASLSKQFTAAALILLEQQGKVDFSKPVATYLKNLNSEFGDKITLHHLLSHSSGLGRDIEGLAAREFGHDFISLPAIVELINDSTLYFQPGKKWSYSNLGYALAAAVIESVTGKPYGEAMDSLIFKPLNMKNTGHEVSAKLMTNRARGYVTLPDGVINAAYEDKSYVIGAGSIYSTTSDLFIWSQELLHGKLLSESNRARLFAKQSGRYGYGWFIGTYVWEPVNGENQALNPNHDGGCPGFSTKLSLLTKHDMAVVILSNNIPTPMNGLSNMITNVCLGFEESPPRPNGSKELYAALFDGGVEAGVKLARTWRPRDKRYMLPDKMDVLLVGRGYLESHDYEKAVLIFDFLSTVNSRWTYPYLFKGIAMEKQNKTEEAIALYKKILKLNPSDSNASTRLDLLKK